MKFGIEVSDFLVAVQEAARAAASKSTKPVLTCVRLEAADDTLTASGTDMETGAKRTVSGVKVTGGGVCVLHPDKLLATLKEVGGWAEVEVTGEQLKVKAGGTWKFPIHGETDEFSAVPDLDAAAFTLPAEGLARLLRQVTPAANRKDNSPRYQVNGVLCETEGGVFRLVGTDLKRLAVGELAADSLPAVAGALLPLKTAKLLDALLSGGGEVSCRFGPNEALFECGPSVLYTRLMQGKYPMWRQIVPKKAAVKFTISAAEFGAKVRQAAVTSDDESKRVNLAFTPGLVTMTATGPETGASEVTLDLVGSEADLNIAFDPLYLLDALKAALEAGEGEPVTLEMTDREKPAVVRYANGFTLVMPMGTD